MKSGYVAIIGRPNVGKSTLINRLVGQKLSIVSDKPQTTRHRILGVYTEARGQIALVDTPGVHRPAYAMNRRMMHIIYDSLSQVDLLLLMIDVTEKFGHGDKFVIDLIGQAKRKSILLLNKIDLIKKPLILPIIERYRQAYAFLEFLPISALHGEYLGSVIDKIFEALPEGEPLFPSEYLTDRTERFIVAELIREKVLAHTRAELPYSTAVRIDLFDEAERQTKKRMRIAATVFVEKPSQRAILLGHAGAMIKKTGTAARHEIESFLEAHVFLELYIKVEGKWRNNPAVLDQLGV
ncbi:MAG: GTPase Era [Acidobacteria bacterium]|nr:GTPase Era [Acidobacteriota bacterium]